MLYCNISFAKHLVISDIFLVKSYTSHIYYIYIYITYLLYIKVHLTSL